MESIKNYVGIDISKDSFDFAVFTGGKYHHQKLPNTSDGFKALISMFEHKEQYLVVMEASGAYYLRLACHLYEHGIGVSVINPLVVRRFCQMRLSKAKTDKKDAKMIAEYGKAEQPALWQPEPSYVLELKQMQSAVDQFNKSRTGLIRQMEALSQNTVISKDVVKATNTAIRCMEKQIAALELKMQQLAEQYYGALYQQLQTIPGLGKKTALLLIVVTGGFKKFANAKQVSSYFGLCPRIFESGTSVKGRAKITKMGMSRIRAMLYLCAWSAKKCNNGCKQLYDRLVEKGKAKRSALVAVANKLIKQAFALATQNTTYEADYQKNICF
jgi:transposase